MSFWRDCLMPCSSHTLLSMQSLQWFVLALHVSEVTTTLSLVVVSLANTIYDGLNIPYFCLCVWRSKFSEVEKSRQMCWFKGSGKIDCRMLPARTFHIHMAHSFDASDHGWLDLRIRNLQNSKNDLEDEEWECFMSTYTGVSMWPIGQFKLLPSKVLENGWAGVWCWRVFCGGRRETLYVEVQYEMCSRGAMVEEWPPYGWAFKPLHIFEHCIPVIERE